MKLVVGVTLLLVSGTIGTLYYLDPKSIEKGVSSFQSEVHSALYDKEIRIEGVELLEKQDIHKLLPLDRSVIWWSLFPSEVEGPLLQNPFVSKAHVERCPEGLMIFDCFRVTISERRPTFVSLIGDRAWVIGDDGGLMLPVPRAIFEESSYEDFKAYLGPSVGELKIIKGIGSANDSPEVIQARLQYARRCTGVLEEESKFEIELIELLRNNELSVKFRDLPFVANFDSVGEDMSRLREEARRLRRLVEELGTQVAGIEGIDLAFDKVAVVRLTKRDETEKGRGLSTGRTPSKQ